MNNQVTNQGKFSVSINSKSFQQVINQSLGDPKLSQRFTAALMSAVANNRQLQQCDPATILSGALVAESLNFSHHASLGHYYLVPFNTRTGMKAQFQMGYKGYIQLAIRSGQYKKINVSPIKEGELVSYNPLTEEIEVNLITDPEKREKATTVGYYAFLELTNGFFKSIYWSKEKMIAHAKKYSKAFNSSKQDSFWFVNFDGMAAKTMLRQLISKWGVMSAEMITGFAADMGVVREDGNIDYIDNDDLTGADLDIEEQDDPTVNGETIDETQSFKTLDINDL